MKKSLSLVYLSIGLASLTNFFYGCASKSNFNVPYKVDQKNVEEYGKYKEKENKKIEEERKRQEEQKRNLKGLVIEGSHESLHTLDEVVYQKIEVPARVETENDKNFKIAKGYNQFQDFRQELVDAGLIVEKQDDPLGIFKDASNKIKGVTHYNKDTLRYSSKLKFNFNGLKYTYKDKRSGNRIVVEAEKGVKFEITIYDLATILPGVD
ncbi:hypothetical protein J4408_02975 [Candidatus Pacearchaeota archaeon]|nr:hypothetical protein [Candidatus Pacearchaeota archaeon]